MFTLSASVAANFFTAAEATATNDANSGVVTAAFPATGDLGNNAIPITNAEIIVTAPVKGAMPDTTASAGSGGAFYHRRITYTQE